MVKNFILAAMVGIGIAGLVFAVQKNTNLSINGQDGQVYEIGSRKILAGNNLVSDRPFVEQLNEKSLKTATGQDDQNGAENLTEEFTKNLAEKIALENSNGLVSENGQNLLAVPDADQIAIDLLAEAASKFDIQKLVPEIKDIDIKITKNSKEVILAFADKFDEANLGIELPKLNNREEFNANIGGLIEDYKKTIAALYELTVPELFINLHKTNLAYLSAELTLLEKMKAVQEDPMAAILASKNFLDLEKDFVSQLAAAVSQLDYSKLTAIFSKE